MASHDAPSPAPPRHSTVSCPCIDRPTSVPRVCVCCVFAGNGHAAFLLMIRELLSIVCYLSLSLSLSLCVCVFYLAPVDLWCKDVRVGGAPQCCLETQPQAQAAGIIM